VSYPDASAKIRDDTPYLSACAFTLGAHRLGTSCEEKCREVHDGYI